MSGDLVDAAQGLERVERFAEKQDPAAPACPMHPAESRSGIERAIPHWYRRDGADAAVMPALAEEILVSKCRHRYARCQATKSGKPGATIIYGVASRTRY